MSNVIEFKRERWCAGPVECFQCKHEWVGVWPEGLLHLYCPKCDGPYGLPLDEQTPAEPEAETIETLKAENFKLASGQCTEGGPWGDKGGTPYCKYAKRKPMTAKEMLKGIDADTYPYEEVLAFVTGIRYAEKHHGITDADV